MNVAASNETDIAPMATSGASARLALLMATNCPHHGKHSPFGSHLVEELAAKEERNSVSVREAGRESPT